MTSGGMIKGQHFAGGGITDIATVHSRNSRGSTCWLQEFWFLAFKCWDV